MEIIQQLEQGDYTGLEEFVDVLIEHPAGESLQVIKKAHAQVYSEHPTEQEQFFLRVLESFWNFFQAQIAVVENADFQTGLQQIELAAKGFESIKMEQLANLSAGFELYFSAVVDLRTFNINSGLQKIEQVRAHFSKIDKYGEYYARMIDSCEAEGLFVAGLQSLMQMDYENGEIQIEKASRATKKLAQKYFKEDSLEYSLYMGFGYLYASYSNFFVQMYNLNTFNFDYFNYRDVSEDDEATQSIGYLTNAYEYSEMAKINLKMAKIINLLSGTVCILGNALFLTMDDRKDEIVIDFNGIKKMTKTAGRFAVEIGETGIIFVRLCKQIDFQIANVERKIRSKISKNISIEPAIAVDKIRQLLQHGKTADAIDDLIKNSNDYEFFNDLIVLRSRFSRMKHAAHLNLMTDDEASVEESKIVDAVLALLK